MGTGSANTRRHSIFLAAPLFHISLIIIVGILVYSNTFNVPFVFDDESSITKNHVIKNLHDFVLGGSGYQYNPRRFIGYLTIALNYHWGGANVVGYHIVNLAIHLGNGLLFYMLVRLTFRTPFFVNWQPGPQLSSGAVLAACESGEARYSPATIHHPFIPLFAALLFVCHPIQTQAVTYIIQRLASLATLFYLLSLVLYARARLCDWSGTNVKRWMLYALSLVSAILAMRTKEIAFTLPVVVVLYEFLFFDTTPRKRLLFLAPLLLLLLVIPISVVGSGKPIAGFIADVADKTRLQTDMPRLDYLFTEFRVIVTYLRLLIFPANQNLDYDYPIYRSFFTPGVFLSFLLLLAIFSFAVYLLYRSRPASHGRFALPESRLVSFGILWFFVTLSVESSIIPIVDVIYEHRLYLPSVGAFMAISALAAILLRSVRPVPVIAVATAVVTVLAGATFARNLVWGDALTLARDIVRKSPALARAHYNLALALDGAGRTDEALREAAIAAKLDREDARPWNLVGMIEAKRGRTDDAIEAFNLALELYPDAPYTHLNLGVAYMSKGMTDRAMEHFFTAMRLDPKDPEIWTRIGKAYRVSSNTREAISFFERAVALDPSNPEYRFNLQKAIDASLQTGSGPVQQQ